MGCLFLLYDGNPVPMTAASSFRLRGFIAPKKPRSVSKPRKRKVSYSPHNCSFFSSSSLSHQKKLFQTHRCLRHLRSEKSSNASSHFVPTGHLRHPTPISLVIFEAGSGLLTKAREGDNTHYPASAQNLLTLADLGRRSWRCPDQESL